MLHVSLTRFGVVRGTSRELVDAAARVLAHLTDPVEIPEPRAAEGDAA